MIAVFVESETWAGRQDEAVLFTSWEGFSIFEIDAESFKCRWRFDTEETLSKEAAQAGKAFRGPVVLNTDFAAEPPHVFIYGNCFLALPTDEMGNYLKAKSPHREAFEPG